MKDEVELKALLLAKITKYYEICADQKELEKSAADQSRLMGRGTRGDPGRLLREEKMRKRVQKDLPKVRLDRAYCLHLYTDTTTYSLWTSY